MTRRFLCSMCIHHKINKEKEKGIRSYCKAFPEGIPREIFMEYITHYYPLKEQKNKVVFESKNEEDNKSRNIKFRKEIQSKEKLKSKVINSLKEIIKNYGIDKSSIKLVAFWLEHQNSSSFFWQQHYHKRKLYVTLKNLEIIEFEELISSDFIKNAHNLLRIENIQNHNSSMHIHLLEDGTDNIYFSIENRSSILNSINSEGRYNLLRKLEHLEKVKESKLYEGCKKIGKEKMFEMIEEWIKPEEDLLRNIRPYKIFLFFYIRKILATPFECQLIFRKLNLKRKKTGYNKA